MCLKIGKHLYIQITYKILWLGFPKHFCFEGFQLAFKEGFLVIFMKNMVDPLGIKFKSMFYWQHRILYCCQSFGYSSKY